MQYAERFVKYSLILLVLILKIKKISDEDIEIVLKDSLLPKTQISTDENSEVNINFYNLYNKKRTKNCLWFLIWCLEYSILCYILVLK